MIKLRDNIDWEVLDDFGDFRERSLFSGIDEIPDDLRWWSYWKNVPPHGFIEFIEVNMGTREIRCQGCLDELYEMIMAGIVESVNDEVTITADEYGPVKITTHTMPMAGRDVV